MLAIEPCESKRTHARAHTHAQVGKLRPGGHAWLGDQSDPARANCTRLPAWSFGKRIRRAPLAC